MSEVHIFTAPSQPAIRFVDRCGAKPFWFKFNPRAAIFAQCCKRERWAKYLRVQVFYDSFNYFCAKGHGCKK